MNYEAGAGRGKQGGPTAEELRKYEEEQNRGIYTAEMGPPPQDIDMKSVKSPKAKKYAGGGSVRGGGCEQRGRTRGKFV